MGNILNIPLKKDVFEGLKNGTMNSATIIKTDWWTKRLVSKSGEFKEYDILRVNSGSDEKIDYEISNIDTDEKNNYVIYVKGRYQEPPVEEQEKPVENIVQEPENKETPEPVKVVEKPVFPVKQKEKPKETPKEERQVKVLKERVKKVLIDFTKSKNVFSIPTPVAVIKTDGRIMGTNRKLMIDADLDTRIDLKTEELVVFKWMSDDQFMEMLEASLKNYSRGNYVFVCPNKCVWDKRSSGEDVLILTITGKKTYLFGRR